MGDLEKCKWEGFCAREFCVPEFCNEYEGVEMNNADRIRELSDHKLANLLAETYVAGVKLRFIYGGFGHSNLTTEKEIRHKICYEFMRWLRQPTTEDSIWSD